MKDNANEILDELDIESGEEFDFDELERQLEEGLEDSLSELEFLDVVLFPISGNMRGLGGRIKFVTVDNPELPVMNPQRGWDVAYRGEVNSGMDLARGNCF